MASITGLGDMGDEDSLLADQRSSLLDIILDRHRSLSKKSLLHRMVIISKLQHQNFKEIGDYYDNYFKNCLTQFQLEGVTGLLLIYPRHCVHVIETSTEMLLEVCRDLRRGEQDASGHTERSKILVVSHDIPQRLYQAWSYRVLDVEAPRLEEYDSSDDAEKLAAEMLQQLLKLGAFLAKQPTLAVKKVLDNLHERKPELLPEQGVIGYLVDSNEICVMRPAEYLAKYEMPYDTVLASELVWPMPVNLFPYS